MKLLVKKRSDSVLHVDLRPNALILFIAGLAFIAMGVFTLFALAQRVEFAVEHGEVRYEKRFLGIPSDSSFTLPADSITGIEVVLKEDFSPSYEVVVEAGGTIYDTSFPSSDGDKKREIAEQSLAALSQGDGAFRHEEDATVVAFLLGGVCLAGGLFCWFSMQSVTILAHRNEGTFSIRRRRRLFPSQDRIDLPLDQVAGVRVAAETMNTPKHSVTSYQVRILQEKGKPIPVAKGPMFTAASAEELRELLVAWLGERS